MYTTLKISFINDKILQENIGLSINKPNNQNRNKKIKLEHVLICLLKT